VCSLKCKSDDTITFNTALLPVFPTAVLFFLLNLPNVMKLFNLFLFIFSALCSKGCRNCDDGICTKCGVGFELNQETTQCEKKKGKPRGNKKPKRKGKLIINRIARKLGQMANRHVYYDCNSGKVVYKMYVFID